MPQSRRVTTVTNGEDRTVFQIGQGFNFSYAHFEHTSSPVSDIRNLNLVILQESAFSFLLSIYCLKKKSQK